MLLLEDREFTSRPSGEGKAQHSCGFRTRSSIQVFPELVRDTIQHHAVGPSQAIDRVRQWPSWSRAWKAWHRDSRGMHRKSESVLSWGRTGAKIRIAKNLLSDPILQTDPSPRGLLPLSHFFKATMRAAHWETGQRPGHIPEAQMILLIPSGTGWWRHRCLLLDQRLLSVPLAGAAQFQILHFLAFGRSSQICLW